MNNNPNHHPWKRGFYMVLFAFIYKIVVVFIFLTAFFQFGHNVLLGMPQPKLVKFGKKLSDYNYKIYMFITFNSNDRPYPFEDD